MELTDFAIIFGTVGLALFAVVITLRWEPMMVLVLASAMVETYFGLDVGIDVDNLTLRLTDAIAVMALAATLLRFFAIRHIDAPVRWWLLVSICWGVAALYGSTIYGLATALSFYRQHFYLSAIALYLMTFHLSAADIWRAAVIWVGAATIIMIYSLLAKIDPTLISDFVLEAGNFSIYNAYAAERVIVAGAAMVMCQAALICLGGWVSMKGALFMRLLTVALIIMMFLQYHRTTWLAFIAGALAMAQTNLRYFARLAPIGALVICIVAILWLTGLAAGQDFLTPAVTQAISEPLDARQSTAIWRIEGWRILVGEAIAQGPFRILFGAGFGVGYERQIGNASIIFSPHNMYVEIFLNAGLIGLLPMLAFFASLLRRSFALQRAGMPVDGLDPSVAVALIVSILVYCISYSLGHDQAVLIGLLTAALASQAPVPQQQEQDHRLSAVR